MVYNHKLLQATAPVSDRDHFGEVATGLSFVFGEVLVSYIVVKTICDR